MKNGRKSVKKVLSVILMICMLISSFSIPGTTLANDSSILLAKDAEWKYLVVGSDQGAAWRATDFDDSNWAKGKAPLGFGDAVSETDPTLPLATEIGFGGDPANKNMTTYFRNTINVSDLNNYSELEVYLHTDDGAVVYINGTEAFRRGIADGVEVNYDTGAKFSAKEETFKLPATALKEGLNTIAAEVHQDGGDSSDLWFEMSIKGLTGQEEPPVDPEPAVTPDLNAPTGVVSKVTVTFNGDTTSTKGFTWYTTLRSVISNLQVVEKISATSDFSNPIKFDGTCAIPTYSTTQFVHKAEATSLKANTEYFFRVGEEALGLWSEVGTFKTAPQSGAFTFVDIADPQAKTEDEAILSSETIAKAMETVDNAEFLAINGDIVDTGSKEEQWDWVFGHSQTSLLNTTVLPVAGNHESQKNSFMEHFDIKPAANSPTTSGAYYSYDYSNAHFIILNNNESSTEYADFTPAQIQWMKDDVAAAKSAGAKWIIVIMHKGPYTTSNHATDSDIVGVNGVRTKVAPIMSQLGIDLVLQGHDHGYARSKPIKEDGTAATADKITETFNGQTIEYTVNPDGSIYLIPATAGPKVYYKNTKINDPTNSSYVPGYYDLFDVADENHAAVYGPDSGDASRPMRAMVQNFEAITIDGDKLTVVSYEIDQGDKIDGDANHANPYIIEQFGIEKQSVPTDTNYTNITFSPGRNATELNFAWYSDAQSPSNAVQVAKKADMTGTEFPAAEATTFTGTVSSAATGFYSNKVIVTGLQESKDYVYRVGDGSKNWSPVYEFTTHGTESYSFLAIGDAQIGSSGSDASDTAVWKDTMSKALAQFPNVSYLLSLGDQVESNNNEAEYTGFLAPPELRSLPLAPLVGNHDNGAPNYSYHFNLPNLSSQYGITSNTSSDYYFTYGNTLVMVLNSNNTSGATHAAFIGETVAANSNATWKVAMFHHDIYGSGGHAAETGIINLRQALFPIFDQYDVDLVLTGHDHSYTRTYQMYNDQPIPGQNSIGTVYMTLNSGSGSKYYDIQATPETYAAFREQIKVPTFSKFDVTADTLNISTYRTDTLAKTDTYTISKEAQEALDLAEVTATADGDTLTTENPSGTIALSVTAKDSAGASLDLSSAYVLYKTAEPDILSIAIDGKVTVKNAPAMNKTVQVWAEVYDGSNFVKSNELSVNVTVPIGLAQVTLAANGTSISSDSTTGIKLSLTGKDTTGADMSLSSATVEYTTDKADILAIAADGTITVQNTPERNTNVQITADVTVNGKKVTSNALSITVTTGAGTEIIVPVKNALDDIEERADGSLDFDSSDLEIVLEKPADTASQLIGIRFVDLAIPQGATITDAYIQFSVDEVNKDIDPFNVHIYAENVADSGPFIEEGQDPMTATNAVADKYVDKIAESVEWKDAPSWTIEHEVGTAEQTPNLASLVQTVVDKTGWSSGNAISFLLSGEGRRIAESFDGSGNDSEKPTLHVNYVEKVDSNVSNVEILATSDLHGNIYPYDYFTGNTASQGLAKVSTYVDQERQSNPNLMLIDNGDTIQGTPLATYYATIDKTSPNPMLKAMAAMHYDTWTLGNHEFNFGLDMLDKVTTEAEVGDIHVLSANTYKDDNSNLVEPYYIKTINTGNGDIKVGILGLTTKCIPNWENSTNYEGLHFNDLVTEAQKWVPIMRTAGADVIVASIHSGEEGASDVIPENQIKAVAQGVNGIDAIVAGHTHAVIQQDSFTNPAGNMVIVTEPGKWGQYVSKLQFALQKQEGQWAIVNSSSQAVAMDSSIAVDSTITSLVQPNQDATLVYLGTKIGTATDAYSGADQLTAETAIMDLINKVQQQESGAQLSIAAPLSSSAMIPKGDVTIKDISSVYIYENFLYSTNMTGAQLKKWMEHSVRYYKQVSSPSDPITKDTVLNIPDYNLDQLYGANYTVDLTQPAGSRIKDLTYNGNPILDTDVFTVAINNYRYNGGGGFMAAAGLTPGQGAIYDSMKTLGDAGQVRNLLIDYIQDQQTITPTVDNYWSISKGLTNGDKIFDIVEITDLHGNIGDTSSNQIAAVLAQNVKNKVSADNPNRTLILAGGDNYQGTAISNLQYGKPVMEIFNYMGVAASALGNHEFDWGLDKVTNINGSNVKANYPIVCANLFPKGTTSTPVFDPYKIFTLDGVKIAVVGGITELTPSIVAAGYIEDYDVLSNETYINKYAEQARTVDGAQIVIALIHEGGDSLVDIAKNLTGVDAVLGGHTHNILSTTVTTNSGKSIPVAVANYNGKGYIDLKAILHSNGSLTFANADAAYVAQDTTSTVYPYGYKATTPTVDLNVKQIIGDTMTEEGPILSEILGSAQNTMTRTQAVSPYGESLAGNWATDIMRSESSADFAFQNNGGLRCDLPQGQITMSTIYQFMPFDNVIMTCDMTGAQLKVILEQAVADGGYGIQLSGMNFGYDGSKPSGSRVYSIAKSDGTLVNLNDTMMTYKVATNDFLAGGTTAIPKDGFSFASQSSNMTDTHILVREALANAIRDAGTTGITASIESRIKNQPVIATPAVKIAVISDTHYFAPELGNTGSAFEQYLAGDRKMIAESKVILESTIAALKNSPAEIVLVSGDLTKDGELLSHQQFAGYLQELENTGKKVYVIDGNHDINNPKAESYSGDQTTPVAYITPSDFKTIYQNFGYEEAVALDPNSLSYVVDPIPGLRIIAMDSVQYDTNIADNAPKTAGAFSADRQAWINAQIADGVANGKTVIGMMHHGVTNHFSLESELFPEYVIKNADQVASDLSNSGMKVVFTGHFHAQDITKKTLTNNQFLFDLETGSLVTSPVPYRLVDLTTDGKLNITTNRITDIDYNTGGKDFQTYAQDYLVLGLNDLVPQMLADIIMQQQPSITLAQAMEEANDAAAQNLTATLTVKDCLVNAMLAHYQGDEVTDSQLLPIYQGMAASTDAMTKTIGGALLSLGTDLLPADNNITINLNNGNIEDADEFTVSIASLTGGSITASPTSAASGAVINLTIIPDAGMQLQVGSLKYNDGTQDYAIDSTSFTMPTANVAVSAVFKAISNGGGGSSGGGSSGGSSGGSTSTPISTSTTIDGTIKEIKRLSGLTRVDTALEIAKANYTTKLSNVVLATAENYPDALAGSVLAYKLKAPILLVGSTEADQMKILAYLKSNVDTSGTVYILGGTAVVSAEMEAKVTANGFNHITRLGGIDRYETAVKIADQIGVKTGTPIVLAYGENYPDALSISSIAAGMQSPILLVQKDRISDTVKQEIAKIKPSKVYIIGGEGVISATLESQVAQITSLDKTNIIRIGGVDRYETSLAVAQYFNLTGQNICIATGNNFPDALAGSVYAANRNAPIILADGSLSDQVMNYLQTRTLTEATLFGGEAVVSKDIELQLKQLIGQ